MDVTRNYYANPGARIRELDVLRGFAVLGIFWVNIVVFGLPTDMYTYPTLFSGNHGANIAVWAINDIFVEGTMRGLFSMLFGASAMIFLDEARQRVQGTAVVDRFYRRNLLLMAFGIFHAYVLLWPYDVLYVYGLLGMFLFPLRKIRAEKLLVIGCLMLVYSDVSVLSFDDENTTNENFAALPVQISASESRMRDQLLDNIADEISFRRSGYATIFTSQIPEVINQQSMVIYTTNIFDMGGMMLLGIALLKFGVLTGKRSTRFYLLLGVIGYAVGISARSIPVHNLLTHDHLSLGLPPFDGIDYSISRLPVAIGHMCMIMLLCRTAWLDWLSNLLAPIGRMALTSYLLQSCFAIFVFYGFGLGLFGVFERYQLVYICMAMWLFHVIFSKSWLHYFRQGPLEWLWRSIIYGELQAFRKTA